jgi:hypothetical protein
VKVRRFSRWFEKAALRPASSAVIVTIQNKKNTALVCAARALQWPTNVPTENDRAA